MKFPGEGYWIGLVSGIWSSLSYAAREGARRGWLKTVKLDSKVISVGNIQVGGAGKTPLVALIANEAASQGFRVCILTRGYRSRWESEGGVILPNASAADPDLCGDEAALLHDLCPFAYIGVGKNRARQFDLIRTQTQGIDLVVLDDGFQNWKIKKDLEVVALTSAKPTDLLFRDFPKAVENANLLVWTKGMIRPPSGSKPIVVVRYELPVNPHSSEYWLVTGVANSDFVESLAVGSGYRISKHTRLPDHARYDRPNVQGWLKEAAHSKMRVLLTGKDWVKWRALGVSQSEVTVIEPKLQFQEGRELWSQILWEK